ncbi:MAG: hypothetical protein R3212_13225, partial [Xanthomonadales bacterium]|nr:hypothetical protein [Xanthomonadales bacterium]
METAQISRFIRHVFPAEIVRLRMHNVADIRSLLDQPGTILLDTARPDAENRRCLLFAAPERVLTAESLGEVLGVLTALDEAVAEGYH